MKNKTEYYSHISEPVIAEVTGTKIVVTDRHKKETQTGKFDEKALKELNVISKATYEFLSDVLI